MTVLTRLLRFLTGILTQISINVGIFAAQAFSSELRPVCFATALKRKTDYFFQITVVIGGKTRKVPLSKPMTGNWRIVQLISALVALAQVSLRAHVPIPAISAPC